MKTYILSIAGIILLSAVVSIIAPNGKMGVFVKGMTKLLILVVIVAPLISIVKKGEFDCALDNFAEDTPFLEYCAGVVSSDDEKQIAAFLLEDYGVLADVKAVRSADGKYTLEKITVKVLDLGIFGQDEHIDNISRIQIILQEKYGCEAVVYDARKTDNDLEK